ncbi:hypothetical protein [Marinobacter pelagius]|uniref:Uncharacterized protein n=1 Tax=Marinobacter pelagius TaxID=379482 RepID=A0A1I4WYU3_9GAMM|nr:hypothetical protein [Marinobacter pelagius]SFN18575.1 hypothetical protein SAMN04487961_2383 [Marinobacter pelagius]
MYRTVHSGVVAVAILGLLVSQAVSATSPSGFGEHLTDQELSELRGGFVVLDNLEIAIGLEQLVAVNGQTMVLNRLTIPNLNQVVDGGRITARVEQVIANALPGGNDAVVTPPEAPQSSESVSGSTISLPIRVSSEMDAGNWMTIIQNRLDSTVIQNMQQLNIELNNLGSAYRFPQGVRDSLPILP